jgi:dihydrofolate reductase
MRELIVTEFITLDGVIEAPGGEPTHPHTGWTIDFAGPEQLQYKLNEVLEAEALLLGRKTYEGFAEAWTPREGEFADKMNAMPKYVASTTLAELGWNATLLQGDVPAAVAALKQGDGGPILVAGSGTLAHTLIEHDLVDEYRLMVFPTVLGGGKRLFEGGADASALRLTDSRPAGECLILIYEPARDAA